MSISNACRFVLALTLVTLGCQGEGIGPSDQSRLRIIAGGEIEDTVLARPSAPLVVELRDSTGAPRAGVVIHLESRGSGPNGNRVILRSGDSTYAVTVTDTTDSNGQVSVRVVFGFSAGVAWVRAIATAFALSDSTRFVVRPGALTRLTLDPADTATLVGADVTLRARATDYWGNGRDDVVEWSVGPETVELAAPGRVRGVRIGRGFVRAQVGAFSDSVGINVVPPGEIAAMFFPIAYGEPPYFVLFRTDGTGFRRIDVGADCAHGVQWSSTGEKLLFGRNWAQQVCFTHRLYSSTVTGGVQKIRPDTAPLAAEYWPRMTADGEWIYFSGRPGHQNGEIWRVRPDGTGAERIGPAAGFYDLDQHPSPSPNGAEVVYASTREAESSIFLRIINTTTREVRPLGVTGMSPSWSPRGDLIAFLRGDHYYVIAADGSGERGLVDSRYSAGMPDPPSWSPDGNWIVAVVPDPAGYAPFYGRLALVEVETGLILPLGWTPQLTYPTWRPASP